MSLRDFRQQLQAEDSAVTDVAFISETQDELQRMEYKNEEDHKLYEVLQEGLAIRVNAFEHGYPRVQRPAEGA
jgi:hypothetical protein